MMIIINNIIIINTVFYEKPLILNGKVKLKPMPYKSTKIP